MKRQVVGLMLATALLGAGYAQAGVLIDNFDTSQAIITQTTPGGTTCSSVGGGGIIGGSREMCLSTTAASSALGATAQVVDVGAAFGGTSLNLNNNAGVDATLTVLYEDLGGVDLTGPLDDKVWFIVRAQSLDHDLEVTVTLTDTNGVSAANTYVKLAAPFTDRCGAPYPTGTDPCPEIVFPIADGGDPGLPGNYYHALSAFLDGGTDPVTGESFGDGNIGPNALLDLNSIDDISVAFRTGVAGGAGQELDLLAPCLYTGNAPSGATPPGTTFGPGDGPTDGPLASQVCHQPVPEPASLLLLGTGMLGLGLFSARKYFGRRQA